MPCPDRNTENLRRAAGINEDGSLHEDAGGVAPFLCSIPLVQRLREIQTW